jgi:hypothetical protein
MFPFSMPTLIICTYSFGRRMIWQLRPKISTMQSFSYRPRKTMCSSNVYNTSIMSSYLSFDHSVQITFDQAIGPKQQELEEKYPEGNDPLFPGKCIYRDPKTGFCWELTSGRLNVWAAHLVCLNIPTSLLLAVHAIS